VAASRVDYTISWSDPAEHLFDVDVVFTASARETRLDLPAWRPGRYLIQNHAANVREWSAAGASGRPLPIRKSGKSTWTVRAGRGEKVRVSYRYFAGVLDAGSSWVDEGEAYFNGSNLFMMVGGQREARATLTIQRPEGWDVETQLPQRGEKWVARDYDHLIDSPAIVSPSMRTHRFEEKGCEVSLVFQNAEGIDTRQYVGPTRAIVREQISIFGSMPTRSYRFLIHVADKWHGVEHEDSCSIVAKRSDLIGAGEGDDGWDHLLLIISHEFFHLWNVKRLLPAAFLPYDYSKETHTSLLWLMEGVTSYFGQRSLRRSGVWSTSRYLRYLAKEIATLESIPGRKQLSLAQASFDSWLQDPSQMHDRANYWISFYNKGEIVAALLDLRLRRSSGGDVSLDALMRKLWKEYGAAGRGLEEDSVLRAAIEIGGRGMRDFFARYVEGTEELPYDELERAGLKIRIEPEKSGRASLGAKFRADGKLLVDSAVSGTTARAAGLLPGDEVIAVNGWRVTSESEADRALAATREGKDAVLVYARHGVLRTRKVAPAEGVAREVSLELAETRGEAQNALLEAWIAAGAADTE
jgi:predicted metalloprotease with PDZ domain